MKEHLTTLRSNRERLEFLLEIQTEYDQLDIDSKYDVDELMPPTFSGKCDMEIKKIKSLMEVDNVTQRSIGNQQTHYLRIDPLDRHLLEGRDRYGGFQPIRRGFVPTPETESEAKKNIKERRGSQYQIALAMYYLLQYTKANCPNTKKAKFVSFLTGYSENTLRQQWSNIHSKKNEDGVSWENDMKVVRNYFQELGLTEIVKMIDNDLEFDDE